MFTFQAKKPHVNTLHCRVIDTAAKQLTKTAITVTAIFIVALGYDLWYYVLAYAGVTEYKMNTPIQKIGKSFFCQDLGERGQQLCVF